MLDGKAFVCSFCLSVKVLELTRLVGELRGEMAELRESVEVLRKENDDLVERVMVVKVDGGELNVEGSSVKTAKKPVSATWPGERMSESGGMQIRKCYRAMRVDLAIHHHCQERRIRTPMTQKQHRISVGRECRRTCMQLKAPPTKRKQLQGVKKFVGRRKL